METALTIALVANILSFVIGWWLGQKKSQSIINNYYKNNDVDSNDVGTVKRKGFLTQEEKAQRKQDIGEPNFGKRYNIN